MEKYQDTDPRGLDFETPDLENHMSVWIGALQCISQASPKSKEPSNIQKLQGLQIQEIQEIQDKGRLTQYIHRRRRNRWGS